MGNNITLNADDINKFDSDFLKFLCIKSQEFCIPTSNVIEEDEYQKCKPAFDELEQFISGSDTLDSECAVGNSVCGKIFKQREPIYTCQECSTDTTCVLCRACFLKSEHVKHNYQMFSSSGGGYCDCGDIEAWKTFARCSLHGGSNNAHSQKSTDNYDNLEDIETAITKLPVNLKHRFLLLSKQIFDRFQYFVMRPLCKENDKIRRQELERELSFIKTNCTELDADEYALVLYNNEIHNFDQVINLFKRSLSCSAEQAMEYANIVDRDGRCVAVSSVSLKDIEDKQQDILSRSKLQTKVELLCRLHHPAVLGLQSFMLHTLRWLYEFVDRYPMLRLLLSQYLFFDVYSSVDDRTFVKSTFIHDIFENHIQTWKMARSSMANFVMSVVMKETYFKRLFAVEFVTNYQMIIAHYAIDDHNVQDSLVSLSCQIYTIISLANYLLEHHNVLRNTIQIAYDELLKYSKPLVCDGVEYRDILIFNKDESESQKKFDPFERQLKSFDDVNYLLTSLLTSFTGFESSRGTDSIATSHTIGQQWTKRCVDNFMDYFAAFTEILSLIQETNTIERVTEHHIEHDPQWRTGIILMYDIASCITLTSNLVVSNTDCWEQAFRLFRDVLNKRMITFEIRQRVLYEYSIYKANVIDNNWPNKYISVIKPLHRFMASLLGRLSYLQQLDASEIDCLFDQAMQMVVFSSQQSANMWIRNGSVPYILTQQMKCLTLSSEMFDRDIQLIQQLALCMTPEEFIVKCIHKFDLKPFLSSTTGILSDKKSLIQRMEDFLHLIIVTLFFRHRPRVGKDVTMEMCYEHIILHILCVKPLTHSKIMKKLPITIQKYSKLTEIIEKVADQSKQSQIVMFSAKKCLIVQSFDRFAPYYSIQDRNEAELNVQNVIKKDGSQFVSMMPKPIELTEDFSGLYGYLSDACLIRLLDRVLSFCNDKRNGEYWTDTMLEMVLCLIGSCLMEDMTVLDKPKPERRTMFIETAMKSDLHIQIIDNLELLCDKITAEHQLELIKWTIRKWHDTKKKMAFEELSCEAKASSMEMDTQDLELEAVNASLIHQNKIIKADAAKMRREQLMNKMKSMQKKFINDNPDLLSDPGDQRNKQAGKSSDETEGDLTCILCQEKSDNNYERPIVAIAGSWRSTVLARHPFTSQSLHTASESNDDSIHSVVDASTDQLVEAALVRGSLNSDDSGMNGSIDRVVSRSILPILDHPEETFITTCGHVMHYHCKTRYMSDMIKQKQNIARTKGVLYPRIYNRCPLCKCVCNIDIPIIRQEQLTNEEEIPRLPTETLTYNDWITFFAGWTLSTCVNKKAEKSMGWWDKLSHKLSNIMKMAIPFRRSDSLTSDEELLSCLAFRVGLAIKLQPKKLTKETYNKYESICSSISESSLQDIIELDYSVAYTISVWEQILGKNCSSLLTDMPERHMVGLHYLIKAVRKSHEQLSDIDNLNRNCQSFLTLLQQVLFDCTKSSLHKDWLELHKFNCPRFILEIDFTFIVTMLLFMRNSFKALSDHDTSSSLNEQLLKFLDKTSYTMNCVRLLYEFVSLQALLSLQIKHIDNVEVVFAQLRDHSADLWTDAAVDGLYNLRAHLMHHMPALTWSHLTKQEVTVCYTRAVMPYLRCTTFLLTSFGAVPRQRTPFDNTGAEFNHLYRLLSLTMLPDTLDRLPVYLQNHVHYLQDNVPSDHTSVTTTTIYGTQLPHAMPHAPPTLIDLPMDFTDVLTRCLDRGCSLRQQATGAVSEMTLCLICGDTFCLNGYCCRQPQDSSSGIVSGAQIHARQCHGGYALFLNTRNSKIVVMFYQARWQIYLDPIYMDRFGEIDVDLKKGLPLFLNGDAYAKLQRSWLDHSIGCIVNDGIMSNDFFV